MVKMASFVNSRLKQRLWQQGPQIPAKTCAN
jgi:hypothetical protein